MPSERIYESDRTPHFPLLFSSHSISSSEMDTSNLMRSADSTIAPPPAYRSIVSDEVELTANTVYDEATLPPSRCESSKTYRWASKEIWWLIALSILTALCAMSFTVRIVHYGWCPYASPLPLIGVLMVLSVARKWRRRWFCFASSFAIFWGADIWWLNGMLG